MKNGKDPDSYLSSPVPFPNLTWTRTEGPESPTPAAASPPTCRGRAPAGTPFPRALCPPPNLEQVGKAWLSSSHAPAPGWAAAESPAGAAQGVVCGSLLRGGWEPAALILAFLRAAASS